MKEQKQKGRTVKTGKRKRTGLSEILNGLEGEEFIVTIPVEEKGEKKHERAGSV